MHQPEFSPRRLIASVLHDGDSAALADCLGCGACEVRCPSTVAFVDFLKAARIEAMPGALPLAHGGLFEVAPELKFDRRSWLPEGLRVREAGEIMLFVGCAPLFDAFFSYLGVQTSNAARAMIRIMNALDVEPVVLTGEVCCGHDQLFSGDQETFERLAMKNVELFGEAGVKTVVTTCAECARCLSLDYPTELGDLPFRTMHASQWLAERLGDLAPGLVGMQGRITYQDPCRLGRHLGETTAPRQILGAVEGLTLTEMERAGVDAVCCGTEGFARCGAASKAIQVSRLRQAAATGAQTLVTACPKCLVHLSCARRDPDVEAAVKELEIFDLTEIVARALDGAGPGKEVPQ
jgi:Fe-S oxidoreductase